ncbi:MAG: ShlB/FhaC/HecB family hemolysin secretion/activation protein [Candidatus Malihini olakiniferum]
MIFSPAVSRAIPVWVVPAGNTLPLHVNLGADNSGTKATSTGQMSTQLTLDNPLQMADL